MKILLFDNAAMNHDNADYFIETKTGNFGRELKDLGNEITFFGQTLPLSDNINVFGIKRNGMQIDGLKRRKIKILSYFFLYLRTIPAVLSTDFVYIFYPNSFKYVAFLCKLFKKRYGIYLRGMQGIGDKTSCWIYRNAYVVFTVTDEFTHFVNKKVGRNIANTIRPMISLSKDDIITSRNYVPKEKYNILYLGRTTNDKGIRELLQAISILKESDHSFFLKIVGSGDNIDEFKDLSIRLNLENTVSFEGGVFDPIRIRKYYLEADIYILPTYHEGFPRTLYEAMIFGTPIVTTFVGGISALMKDDYNCKEIQPKSINSIVEALSHIMKNYKTTRILVKNGTNTIEKILDSKRLTHAQHLNQILNSI